MTAKAWQIASLVARATNEQVCFSTILRHFTTFSQANAVIARRHDEAMTVLLGRLCCAVHLEKSAAVAYPTSRNDSRLLKKYPKTLI